MTNEQMTHYLPSYGDIVGVLSFCHQPNISTGKDILLQRIKEATGQQKSRSTATIFGESNPSSDKDRIKTRHLGGVCK